ncbi:hypothetical protein G6F68_014274 [Rhizopus microsporus]|uniref:Uncharacterized protein n=1 Tax=Rhizopus delemar TaxID=936053 RepID=A0A9P7C1K5_9FUNG|nr:hypothetical protein G6F68_014274 [Rhizopus microsporus]KAG1531363.1 hypothetical protein G6F50_016738 [Rhizopus delemar]
MAAVQQLPYQRLEGAQRGHVVAGQHAVAQQSARLLVAVEDQVFLAGEVVEDRLARDPGGLGDLGHRHRLEAAPDDQLGGDV